MDLAIDQFDKFVQKADGLPGVRKTKPTTVRTSHALTGITTTHIIQSYALPDDEGFVVLIERVDGEGHYRIVLPGAVAASVYRQHKALTDRSTAASRARKARAKARAKAKADRAAKAEKRLLAAISS